MSVTIRSGAARVLASGTVTTFAGHSLLFSLGETDPMQVELSFRVDDQIVGPAVNTVEVPGGMRLELANFDGTEGRGSARPVLLGQEGDDLLFFHFRVMRFGATEDRTVFYTFYRADKSEVGWQPVAGVDPRG